MATITAPVILDSTGWAIVEALQLAAVVPEEINIEDSGAVTATLQPNKFYHFTSSSITSLTITLAPTTGIAQYHFDFQSGSGATLSMPSEVLMPDNFAVEASTIYEVDVFNDLGTVQSWTVRQVSS